MPSAQPEPPGGEATAPVPTERFERVLAFASDEADGLGHGFVTCEHLLYALSRETKGLASAVLARLGLTADALHELVSESAALHDRTGQGRVDLADEARDAIGRAVQAARSWGHRRLDTEHLLYAVVSVTTSADEMLASLRVEPQSVLDTLATLQEAAPAPAIREEATHAYRFTLESAWVLSAATDIARRLGAGRVSTLHLLAALLGASDVVQGVFEVAFGLDAGALWPHLEATALPYAARGHIELAEDVQAALGAAIGQAWNRGHQAVTPLHLAMGLAQAGRSVALDLLADLGVPQADLTAALDRTMPPRVV